MWLTWKAQAGWRAPPSKAHWRSWQRGRRPTGPVGSEEPASSFQSGASSGTSVTVLSFWLISFSGFRWWCRSVLSFIHLHSLTWTVHPYNNNITPLGILDFGWFSCQETYLSLSKMNRVFEGWKSIPKKIIKVAVVCCMMEASLVLKTSLSAASPARWEKKQQLWNIVEQRG